jgi:hypothetical protein
MNTMNENINKRAGNKWTINETLQLQREYELLEWTIQQIAEKHQRSVHAILFKLENERFIDGWNNARGFNLIDYQAQCDANEDTNEEENEDTNEEENNVIQVTDINEDSMDDDINDEMDDDINDDNIDDDMDDEHNRYNLKEQVANLEYKINKLTKIVKKIYKNTLKNNSITAYSTTSSIEHN